MIPRYWYYLCYLVFLILLAVTLWYLLFYAEVPSWVYSFFISAIVLAAFGLLIKEIFLLQPITPCGTFVPSDSYSFWSIFYTIFHIIAIILIIIGFILVIVYSTVPWYVWFILGAAIFLFIVIAMLFGIAPGSSIVAIVFYVIVFALFITAIVLIVIYSNSPWWVWLLSGLTFLFALLAGIFEIFSEPNQIIISDECCTEICDCDECQTQQILLNSSPPVINLVPLPTSTIPEQIVT